MALAPPPPHQRATLIPLTRPKTHEWYAPNQGVFAPGTFSKGNKFKFSRDFSSFLFGRTTFYMQKKKTEILIHILRKCTQALAVVFWWSYERVLILIISTLIHSPGIHTGAHLVNFRRFSTNYSFDCTDLNFASHPNQVRSRIWFSLHIFYSVSVHSVYTTTPSLH